LKLKIKGRKIAGRKTGIVTVIGTMTMTDVGAGGEDGIGIVIVTVIGMTTGGRKTVVAATGNN
jgi:hypothetical protein